MTPTEQRIAIAEACGLKQWKDEETGIFTGDWSKTIWTKPPYHLENAISLPDDLNAMHEAEKMLTLKQRERYYEELGRESGWLIICSTAEQRALAFLRTIGRFD